MTAADWQAMAAAAACHWGQPDRLRLIKARENVVFEVLFQDGRRAALRLHRPRYQKDAAILAELDWTAVLSALGLSVPTPLRTLAGGLLADAAGRRASCVGWLDGVPLGDAAQPLSDDAAARFGQVGALIGRLHNLTDAMPADLGAARPAWDMNGLLGEAPLWGRFWDNPAFVAKERDDMLRCRGWASVRLLQMIDRGADAGLIHADLMRENILVQANGLALIDFDDSGRGFRGYDLGTALVQCSDDRRLDRLTDDLLAGYLAERPDSRLTRDDVLFFTALRAMASAGWITDRAAPDDPRQRFYCLRALQLARKAGAV